MLEYLFAEAHGAEIVQELRAVARELVPAAGTTPRLAMERLADSLHQFLDTNVKQLVEEVKKHHTAQPPSASTGAISAPASSSAPGRSAPRRSRGSRKASGGTS